MQGIIIESQLRKNHKQLIRFAEAVNLQEPNQNTVKKYWYLHNNNYIRQIGTYFYFSII